MSQKDSVGTRVEQLEGEVTECPLLKYSTLTMVVKNGERRIQNLRKMNMTQFLAGLRKVGVDIIWHRGKDWKKSP